MVAVNHINKRITCIRILVHYQRTLAAMVIHLSRWRTFIMIPTIISINFNTLKNSRTLIQWNKKPPSNIHLISTINWLVNQKFLITKEFKVPKWVKKIYYIMSFYKFLNNLLVVQTKLSITLQKVGIMIASNCKLRRSKKNINRCK